MEDPTHPGLQEEIEEIQLGVSEHPLQGTDHVHVAEGDLIKEHQRIRRQARPLLKCSKCHKRYRNPTLLLQHVRLHRGSTVYRCGQCEETFKELNKFLDHRATHPPLRKRRKAYDNNGFQFAHKSNEHNTSSGVGDSVTAETAQNMGLPSTSSIMNALCSALSSQADGQNQQTSTVSAKPGGSEGIQIELPTQVKAIYFNHQSPNVNEVMNYMMMLNNKMDSIIKHFNVPSNVQQAHIEMPPLKPQPEEPQPQPQPETTTTPTPTSSAPVPAAPVVHTPTTKEQQQQEYYASTLISSTPSKPWLNVLSSPFTLNMPHISDQAVLQPGVLQSPIAANAVSYIISDPIIEKVFLESRSRGNFAKNLTFQVFSTEERRGRNCTGRVFGRALPKGPLDTGKLNAVKDATFRKYPCHPSLIDITWKKECITAIDSGLRNETRTRVKSLEGQISVPYNSDHK